MKEPVGLDALSALDQIATNHIAYSEAVKAATPAPGLRNLSQAQTQTHRRMGRTHSKIAALRRGR